MSATLGIAVGRHEVRAVVATRQRILWAGSAPYDGAGELADVLAQLAAAAQPRVRRTRVVLERDVAQWRTVEPAPPLGLGALRRHVALDAPRLFRNGQGPMVTDARRISLGNTSAMVAAATSDALSRAIADGCEQAGLHLGSIGPAAEVIPTAIVGGFSGESLVLPIGSSAEMLVCRRGQVIRSRMVTAVGTSPPAWAPALRAMGGDAGRLAGAYAAACVAPRLQLLPSDWALRHRSRHRRAQRGLAIGSAVAWALAAALFVGRAALAGQLAKAEVARLETTVGRVMVIRRDLDRADAALGAVRQALARRSRLLSLLADLTRAVGDSTSLAFVEVSPDSALHLGGLAPSADGVIAALERLGGVAHPRVEAPTGRQGVAVPGGHRRELDRFAIVADLQRPE